MRRRVSGSKRPFRRPREVLAAGALADLAAAARRHAAIEAVLLAALEPPLDRHARLGAAEGDTLVVLADGPAWAARLRFLRPRLLSRLRERLAWPELRDVEVRTRPTPPAADPARPARATLSEPARAALRAAARATANGALAEVLARLSRRRD